MDDAENGEDMYGPFDKRGRNDEVPATENQRETLALFLMVSILIKYTHFQLTYA
jgi:hypothetical protein